MASRYRWCAVPLVFLALYVTAIVFRPPLPVDETRYLSVAWEMFLRAGWLEPLTLNFEPYHHKPPMLFWLISAAWSALGVSRWAAVVPVVLTSMLSACLAALLCRRLLPGLYWRALLIMLGSVAFLLYSTAILFDLTLTVFVLGSLLFLLAYADQRRVMHIIAMGLMLGGGVLTKGPVAWLFWVFPFLLAPYWMQDNRRWVSWYAGGAVALLISAAVVLCWLVPVLKSSSNEFGYWLVWEQTAGRVTGDYRRSHARPFYFYLGVLPVMLLPWILFPRFWQGIAAIKREAAGRGSVRFLLAWLVPTIVCFSLVSGKQPHYLMPLLPGLAILTAVATARLTERRLGITVAVMVLLFIAAHAAFSARINEYYDLRPLAQFMRQNIDRDWAFSGSRYRGELTFLARLERPLDTPRLEDLPAWFDAHPDGFAVILYENQREIAGFEMHLTHRYRGYSMGIFSRRDAKPPKISLSRPRALQASRGAGDYIPLVEGSLAGAHDGAVCAVFETINEVL